VSRSRTAAPRQHLEADVVISGVVDKRGDLILRVPCYFAYIVLAGEDAGTITLLETLGTAWDMKLLATDISRRVLQTARQGIYEKTKLDGVSPELRGKYFPTLEGHRAMTQASAQLRSLIQFNYLNLMEPWPFSGPFDFIFCRNVMIYFDKPTQERLINRYYDCLDSGGLLFTGHSESLTGVSHKFRYVQPTIYAKP